MEFDNQTIRENFWLEIEEIKYPEPYESPILKWMASITFGMQILQSLVIFAFICYEKSGLTGPFRTVLNQLVSWIALMVSYRIPPSGTF